MRECGILQNRKHSGMETMPFKPGQSGNPATQFKPGNRANPGGKPKLTADDRDAWAVLHGCKADAARLLAAAVRGKRVSPMALAAARDVLDRTEGRARQTVEVQAEIPTFVALLPAVIPDPAEWEARVAASVRPALIEGRAEPLPDPVAEDLRSLTRGKPAAPAPVDQAKFYDPRLDEARPDIERERRLGRYPPRGKFDRN